LISRAIVIISRKSSQECDRNGWGFVVISDDDPIRVHAHGSSAAVQLAVSVFQQPCSLMSPVSHSARLLQRQPAE
jgi:hypothetical protein